MRRETSFVGRSCFISTVGIFYDPNNLGPLSEGRSGLSKERERVVTERHRERKRKKNNLILKSSHNTIVTYSYINKIKKFTPV